MEVLKQKVTQDSNWCLFNLHWLWTEWSLNCEPLLSMRGSPNSNDVTSKSVCIYTFFKATVNSKRTSKFFSYSIFFSDVSWTYFFLIKENTFSYIPKSMVTISH